MELVVADYLAMPKGKGGYIEVLLSMDVYSQRVWGLKLKTHGTGKTTCKGLRYVSREFGRADTFMTDGGPHFRNAEVQALCDELGIQYQPIAEYAPWINGLLEGTNGKLLGRLKRMCAPELGEDGWADITSFETPPRNWPDHFDDALMWLNDRILPALKFSPNELFSGRVVNTARTSPETAALAPPTDDDIHQQLAYSEQQSLDAYSHIAEHAESRKAAFDKRALPPRAAVTSYS